MPESQCCPCTAGRPAPPQPGVHCWPRTPSGSSWCIVTGDSGAYVNSRSHTFHATPLGISSQGRLQTPSNALFVWERTSTLTTQYASARVASHPRPSSTMQMSIEAIIAAAALVVGLPPAIYTTWKCWVRRRKHRRRCGTPARPAPATPGCPCQSSIIANTALQRNKASSPPDERCTLPEPTRDGSCVPRYYRPSTRPHFPWAVKQLSGWVSWSTMVRPLFLWTKG